MSEVGRLGQRVDPAGGGDVAGDGSLLSVADIQRRFREESSGPATTSRLDLDVPPSIGDAGVFVREVWTRMRDDVGVGAPRVATLGRPLRRSAPPSSSCAADTPPPTAQIASRSRLARLPVHRQERQQQRAADIPASWIRVVAAHSGAGASTVALALTDAAAATQRSAHLIESSSPTRSGLIGAAGRELDVDDSGAWRRGLRIGAVGSAAVTIMRRTGHIDPEGWPAINLDDRDDAVVVVDLGLAPIEVPGTVTAGAIVLVCRANLPGVRHTETVLDRLGDATVVVAALGRRRWPGDVSASTGLRLRALRTAGRVITVPLDAHLVVTGPTHLPLPKPLLSAGRDLLAVLDAAAAQSDDVAPGSRRAEPRQKGTLR